MFTDADREELLSSDGFGQVVQIDGVDVEAVFFNGHTEALDMSGTKPRLLARSADVTGATRGTPVVVEGQPYRVITVEPDGKGFALVPLEDIGP